MSEMEFPDELIDRLLGEYQGPEQLTGPDGLINRLRKRLIERAAGAELEQHLGYPPGGEAPEGEPNRRNGTSAKTLRTVDGPVTVEQKMVVIAPAMSLIPRPMNSSTAATSGSCCWTTVAIC
jgi:mutator family transposase